LWYGCYIVAERTAVRAGNADQLARSRPDRWKRPRRTATGLLCWSSQPFRVSTPRGRQLNARLPRPFSEAERDRRAFIPRGVSRSSVGGGTAIAASSSRETRSNPSANRIFSPARESASANCPTETSGSTATDTVGAELKLMMTSPLSTRWRIGPAAFHHCRCSADANVRTSLQARARMNARGLAKADSRGENDNAGRRARRPARC
jgi:hypothetical protein